MTKLQFVKLGPTGMYPNGKSGPDDEGELTLAVIGDVAAGLVRIEFGTPTAWLGLPPKEARELARSILQTADKIDEPR